MQYVAIAETQKNVEPPNKRAKMPSIKQLFLYGVGALVSRYIGMAVGLAMFLLVGAALAGYFAAKYWLGAKPLTSKLVRIMLWSNLFGWLCPVVGAFVAAFTFQLLPRLESRRLMFFIFAVGSSVLCLINSAIGTQEGICSEYTNQAEAVLKQKKYKEAIDLAALGIPHSIYGATKAHYIRGRAELAEKQDAAALRDFEQCNEFWADDISYLKDRAILRFRSGQTSEAMTDVSKYIDEHPEDSSGYYIRAAMNTKLKHEEAVKEDLQQAQKLDVRH
jgi:tetratricopeptide (TPR) repeat protein